MSQPSKTVGVLGGMGPAATLDFFQRVLAASNATRDSEHIRLIIDCNPFVPDRNAAIAGTGPSSGPALADMARGLERAGAELLVMPCNTAHAFLDDIRAATRLPVISIIDVTVDALVADHNKPRRAGVLATTGCVDAGLYQTALDSVGVTPVVPTGAARELFMAVLMRIKAGDIGLATQSDMLRIARALMDAGAEAIIAGCTEVPLVLHQSDLDVPLLNSTDCLVEATIATARAD
jgi:aspartate racemase